MKNNENIDPVGRQILSIAFGVGTISGIEPITEGGDDYYVIEFENTKTKNFFPINENRKIRFLASKDEFMENVEKLKTEKIVKKFDSKKDRQKYFSSCLGDCNLTQVVSRILEINSIKDLIPFEQKYFDKLVGVLEVEAASIYELSSAKSKVFISDFIQKA